MKQYLKMADVFKGELFIDSDCDDVIVDDLSLTVLESFSGSDAAKFALHAISSHDELVKILAVMTELVGKMNCYCHLSGLSAKANSENPVESWMAEADEALDAIRSAA